MKNRDALLAEITGDSLRVLRTLRGIKQETVAQKLNISQQAYSKKERKTILTQREVDRILSALNFTNLEIERLAYVLNKYSGK